MVCGFALLFIDPTQVLAAYVYPVSATQPEVMDRDTTTYTSKSFDVDFGGAIDVTKIWLHCGNTSGPYVAVYDTSGQLICGKYWSPMYTVGWYTWDITEFVGTKRVGIVRVSNSGSNAYFYEIMVECGGSPTPIVTLNSTYSNGRVQLAWSSPDGQIVKTYRIFRNGIKLAETASQSYVDTTVQPGLTYTYVVRYDTEQYTNVGESPTRTMTIPLRAPEEFRAELSDRNVRLYWSSVDGASQYRLYRDGVMIAAPTELSYLDENVNAGETYTYRVQGTNTTVDGEYAELTIYVPDPQSEIPEAPTGFVVTVVGHDAYLSWEESLLTQRVRIYRGMTLIAEVEGNEYVDKDLLPGRYSYHLVAVGKTGKESSRTQIVTVVVEKDPEPPKSPKIYFSKVDPPVISWNIVIGAQSYRIYRDGELLAEVQGTSYIDGSVEGNAADYYVIAIAGGLESAASNILHWQEGMEMTIPTMDQAVETATEGVVEMIGTLLAKFSGVLAPAAIILIACVVAFFWFVQRTKKAVKTAN